MSRLITILHLITVKKSSKQLHVSLSASVCVSPATYKPPPPPARLAAERTDWPLLNILRNTTQRKIVNIIYFNDNICTSRAFFFFFFGGGVCLRVKISKQVSVFL